MNKKKLAIAIRYKSLFCLEDCKITLVKSPDYATQISRDKLGKYVWGCGVVVSHALRMRKAPGSNPGTSTIFFDFLLFH